jgi:hypothetical protein
MRLARVDALIARLQQAANSVSEAAKNERLHKRIGTALAQRIDSYLANVTKRRIKIAGDDSSTEWITIVSGSIDLLFDECLMYVHAARSRGTDVDSDLCELTDLLFEEIAGRLKAISWNNYSTFASSDSYDLRTDVIQIRYPLSTVWDIPIAVHEFGHFLSRRIQQQAGGSMCLPLEIQKAAVVEQKQATQAQASTHQAIDWQVYMDELFADILAAYAIGPAFAFSAVGLRFDPLTSTVHLDGKHPPYADRTFAILETLRRLKGAKTELDAPINLVESFWATACRTAKKSAQPSEADQQWISTQVSSVVGTVNAAEPDFAFTGWGRAQEISTSLRQTSPPAPQDLPIADVLNAAWIVRFRPGSNPKMIHRNSIALMKGKIAKYV